MFDIVKITASPQETKFSCAQDDNTLFLKGKFHEVIPEFTGSFGLWNLGMLEKLLNHEPYLGERGGIKVKRRDFGGNEIVDEINFRDKDGEGSCFKLMNANSIRPHLEMRDPPWDIDIQPVKAKLDEFSKLSALFPDKKFTIKTKSNNLVFGLGDGNSATHSASMVFSEDAGSLVGEFTFSSSNLLAAMKVAAVNAYPTRLCITSKSKGVIFVSVTSPYADYQYILRTKIT